VTRCYQCHDHGPTKGTCPVCGRGVILRANIGPRRAGGHRPLVAGNVPKALRPWLTCKRCGLHHVRRNVVLGVGPLPADVLLVGEAPGKSEDLRGVPFVGKAGRILRAGLRQALASLEGAREPTYYITNVLACHPTDKKRGPNRAPTREETLACWPRLELTERLARPKVIVLLGEVARQACSRQWPTAIHLYHPAYIARRGGTASTEFRPFVRGLEEAFEGAREEG